MPAAKVRGQVRGVLSLRTSPVREARVRAQAAREGRTLTAVLEDAIDLYLDDTTGTVTGSS